MRTNFSDKLAHSLNVHQEISHENSTVMEERNVRNVTDNKDEIQYLPLSEVFADEEFNCRGKIAPIDVVELAKNIEEQGLIQPIIVQPWADNKGHKWRIVAGYRRFIAHIVNKAETIKAIVKTNLSEDDARFMNLAENLNRQDLDLMQEAKAVKKLFDKGHTQEEIKERLNCSRSWVQLRLYTLDLPELIQEEVKAGWIKQEHILVLNQLKKQPEKQLEVAKEIKEKKQRGEKGRIKITAKGVSKNPSLKMARDRKQIQKMLEHILDNVGSSFATRALAWASGELSSDELYLDIRDEASDQGKTYYPPKIDIASEL